MNRACAPLSCQPATVAPLEVERSVSGVATCPLCHTDHPYGTDAIPGSSGWRCTRCGQQWSARRLATVAAYNEWARDLDDTRHRSVTP